jgi:predicted transglutaminase-like cysteine proteinase
MFLPSTSPRDSVVTRHALATASLLLLLAGWVSARGLLFGDNLLEWMEREYGAAARGRVVALQELVEGIAGASDLGMLERVNTFFNRVAYDSDHARWDKKDYWATPFEVLGVNAADCEDYALSKYFTLVSMGVDEARLRITYVKSLATDQPHMVLAYYPTPTGEPLILDNLMDRILPAGERDDLVPVYSFNGADLWLAVNRAEGKRIGGAEQLSRWQAYQARLMQQMSVGG